MLRAAKKHMDVKLCSHLRNQSRGEEKAACNSSCGGDAGYVTEADIFKLAPVQRWRSRHHAACSPPLSPSSD